MADILDTLLGAGKAVAAVPQAVGGTALDILIGDRTNVPAGEQAKRTIETLLLAGDNPGNILALRQMNERRNAANQEIVSSPEFKAQLDVNMLHMDPRQAFETAARQFGVRGYAPTYAAQDAAPGGPSLPDRMPVLPPTPLDEQIKYDASRYAAGRIYGTDPTESELALAQIANMKPSLATQTRIAQTVLETAPPGESTTSLTASGGDISATVKTLPGGQRWFTDIADAHGAAAKGNEGNKALGLPDRYVVRPLPNGGGIIEQTADPETQAAGTARGGVIGKAQGELAPETIAAREEAAKRPTQATRSLAQQTLQNIDSTVPLIDTFLGALRPENVGLLGKLRGAAFGIKGQLDAALGTDAAAALQTLRAQIQEDAFANNLKPGDGGVTPTLFDPNLETTNLIGNVLAYRMARINNPDGKISDADVRDAKTSLEFDQPFTSAAQVQQRVKVFRSMLEQQRAAAARVLKSAAADASPMRGGDGAGMSPLRQKLLQKYGG